MPTRTIAQAADAAANRAGNAAGFGVDSDDKRLYLNTDGTRDPISRDNVRIITEALTLTAEDDGLTVVADATSSLVVTLPATAAGLKFTLVVKQLTSSSGGHAFSPNANDKIMGNGFTSADDKDAICTHSTDREGDSITLVGDGVDGWFITAVTGTWAKE